MSISQSIMVISVFLFVRVFFADDAILVLDDVKHHLLASEHGLGNRQSAFQFRRILPECARAQGCQPCKAHVQTALRLLFAQCRNFSIRPSLALRACAGFDQIDNIATSILSRAYQQPFKDVRARTRAPFSRSYFVRRHNDVLLVLQVMPGAFA
jgi:hypothetical protein